MSAELLMLLTTAVLAVVAITAAVIAVRAAQVVRERPSPSPEVPQVSTELALVEHAEPVTPATLPVRIVEGTVIVPPSRHQVMAAALGRPEVRLGVFARGLSHALRPESRDRIVGLMRREYRQRRRERLRAGRQAVRAARPAAPDTWMSS